jgi:alpha-glucosidase
MKIYKSNEGVIKVCFGKMIPTETISGHAFEVCEDQELRGGFLLEQSELKWTFSLDKEDVVYGLGQNMRGMNKRGSIYESFCSDDPNHTPDKKSLYGAHNFFVVQGAKTWGVYLDFAGRIKYDLGFTSPDTAQVSVEGQDVDLYFFEGTFSGIVRQFRKLIGQSYVPPKWAFGYQQSRWSYEDQDKVREVAESFDRHDLPCDAIFLDIDYMENFKDFTISEKRFPDFKAFVDEMKAIDIKLVPIIDAGVKIEPGYDVYEEGIKNDFFVTDKQGKPFVAAVWPGKVHFPDFLNKDARNWFGNFYHQFLEMGIEGFWNDMNEPAIFYSEQGIKEAIAFVKAQEGLNLDIYTFFELKDNILKLSNAEKDYKSMYHIMQTETGEKKLNHYDVHNLYGYNMTRAAAEGFTRYDDHRRYLLLTRASHIGMAKHSGIWTGDNHAWWEHLKLNVHMMPALNMAGFLYAGADTGGFGGDASGELLVRWMQFSLFTPLLRNHAAMGTRVQEPWQFGQHTTEVLRNMMRMRYAFIPYLYSEYMKANLNYEMLFAPLSYVYGDTMSKSVEDQLLFGESMMLAPVMEQNAKGRYVYLPEKMAMWRIESFESLDVLPFTLMEPGHHHVDVPTHEFVTFLLPGKLVPLAKPANRVSKIDTTDLTVIGYVPEKATYTYFDDDGVTNAYQKGVFIETHFEVLKKETSYSISVDTNDHKLRNVTFYLIDDSGKCHVIKQGVGIESMQLV